MKFYTLDQAKEFGKDVLGGKGHGLAQMHALGVPVPPAIIIPTEVCVNYMKDPSAVVEWVSDNASKFYAVLAGFGDVKYPVVSVRSGARVSMPGMMDTILNVGLDDNTVPYWAGIMPEVCLSDCRRRLIKMFGEVVHGVDMKGADNLKDAEALWVKHVGHPFPNAEQQLIASIVAVFNSWNNERAVYYRKLNNIPDDWGTAVVIQRMVFGNLNDKSATGVMFTADPNTGAAGPVGEFLINGQGEDVVDGSHTPKPLKDLWKFNVKVAKELDLMGKNLEAYFGDVQDIEFTIENGKLYVLQTRNAKRTPQAAIQIAVNYLKTGKIKKGNLADLKKLLTFQQVYNANVASVSSKKKEAFKGIAACSGVAIGKPVFSAEDAINCTEPCVLVTEETTPEDIKGMDKAVGVLTMNGGHTSHAAVVARSMNKPCVVGLGMEWHEALKTFNVPKIAICGATGRVWLEEVKVAGGACPAFKELVQHLKNLTNTPLMDGGSFFDATGMVRAGMFAEITAIKGVPMIRALTPVEEEFFSMFGPAPAQKHSIPLMHNSTMSSMQLVKHVLG